MNLEALTLFFGYDSPSFASCFFPHLRKLSLFGDMCRCRSFDDTAVYAFLEAHVTIEQLTYYPICREVGLSPGSLPALKEITSNHNFAMSILQDITFCSRKMESIGRISLDLDTMPVLEMIDGSELQSLHIQKYDDIQMVHQVAKLFPSITVLEIAQFGLGGKMDESIVRPSFILCFV
jgi:hypothetical protein